MNLRVHEMKRGKISQFGIFPIIGIKEMIIVEKIFAVASAKYYAMTAGEFKNNR